jgi:hypothetical protein
MLHPFAIHQESASQTNDFSFSLHQDMLYKFHLQSFLTSTHCVSSNIICQSCNVLGHSAAQCHVALASLSSHYGTCISETKRSSFRYSPVVSTTDQPSLPKAKVVLTSAALRSTSLFESVAHEVQFRTYVLANCKLFDGTPAALVPWLNATETFFVQHSIPDLHQLFAIRFLVSENALDFYQAHDDLVHNFDDLRRLFFHETSPFSPFRDSSTLSPRQSHPILSPRHFHSQHERDYLLAKSISSSSSGYTLGSTLPNDLFPCTEVLASHCGFVKKEEKRGFAFPRKRGFWMKKEEKQRDLILCLQKYKEHLQWSEIL